jgi:hypothetical protein
MTDSTLRDRCQLGPVLGGGEGSTTPLATRVDTGERCVIETLSVRTVVRQAGDSHTKLFHDGDVVPFRGGAYPTSLDHP